MQANNDRHAPITDWAALPIVLDADTVRAIISVGRNKLYSMAKAGDIPGSIKVGKHWRWSRDRLRAWLEGGGLEHLQEAKAQQHTDQELRLLNGAVHSPKDYWTNGHDRNCSRGSQVKS